MCSKFIKLVVLLSLLVCCGFAGRVLYSRFSQLCRTRERSTSHFRSRGSRAVSLKRTFLCVFEIVQLLSGFVFIQRFLLQFTARFVCLPGLVSGGLLVFCLGLGLTLGVPFRPPLG